MSVEVVAPITVDATIVFNGMVQSLVRNGNVVVHLASTTSDNPVPRYARLGLTERMENRFSVVFDDFLRTYAKQWQTGDIELVPYDPAREQKDHMVEWIYLPDYEMIERQLVPLSDDSSERISPRSMGDRRFVSGLRYYAAPTRALYSASTSMAFYRKYSQSNVLGVSLFGALWDGSENYDQVQESTFVFDMAVDCVQSGHHLFIFNKYNFHVMFRLEELLRGVAQETVERIRSRISIANFDEFERDCQKPLSKLLKLRNIGQRAYLDRITMDDLERVIVDRGLPIEIQTTDSGKHLVYDPSDKWALLTLLDDDHVTGDLTQLPYEAHSKSPIAERRRRRTNRGNA